MPRCERYATAAEVPQNLIGGGSESERPVLWSGLQTCCETGLPRDAIGNPRRPRPGMSAHCRGVV